jgi:hypothetical protein
LNEDPDPDPLRLRPCRNGNWSAALRGVSQYELVLAYVDSAPPPDAPKVELEGGGPWETPSMALAAERPWVKRGAGRAGFTSGAPMAADVAAVCELSHMFQLDHMEPAFECVALGVTGWNGFGVRALETPIMRSLLVMLLSNRLLEQSVVRGAYRSFA